MFKNSDGGVFAGAQSLSMPMTLLNTDGTPATGKTHADLTLVYVRQGAAAVTVAAASTLAALTTAWTTAAVKEIHATNAPGSYRIDFPDAAFAFGAEWVELGVLCTGCQYIPTRVWLVVPVQSRP